MVISYRRLRKTYRSCLLGSRSLLWIVCPLKIRPIYCPQTSVRPIYCPKTSVRPIYCRETSVRPIYCVETSVIPIYCRDTSVRTIYCPKTSVRPIYCPETSVRPIYCPETSVRPIYCPEMSVRPIYYPETSVRPIYCPETSVRRIHCPEMSVRPVYFRETLVTNYQGLLRNIPEKRRYHPNFQSSISCCSAYFYYKTGIFSCVNSLTTLSGIRIFLFLYRAFLLFNIYYLHQQMHAYIYIYIYYKITLQCSYMFTSDQHNRYTKTGLLNCICSHYHIL